MFHTSRGLIVFSERARALMEERAPGQVECIPVAIHAAPKMEDRLNLASAYYFINVLGRARMVRVSPSAAVVVVATQVEASSDNYSGTLL
jgi:hypothetical protein